MKQSQTEIRYAEIQLTSSAGAVGLHWPGSHPTAGELEDIPELRAVKRSAWDLPAELHAHLFSNHNPVIFREEKLWFSHCCPNFNCKCLYSCRHILSFFTLLSFNSSSEWVHAGGNAVTSDHTNTLSVQSDVMWPVQLIQHLDWLWFHNVTKTWKIWLPSFWYL